jgi:outer membrane protein OmpA-like peptidoglycan-associated protein
MKRALALCSLLALAGCLQPVQPLPPRPLPPPPIGVALPHEFVVYFGWNRSWVGPIAMEILQKAADVYRRDGLVNVRVTGHTDTSGSPRYNQRLSELRAHHVAEVLERLGVPRDRMEIIGVGERELAVPTPHGVREPRNRRVTVIEG